MSCLDLDPNPAAPVSEPRSWSDPAAYWAGIDDATSTYGAPVAILHRSALAANAHDMVRRAAGTPIRVASKSLRSRAVLDAVLAMEGFRGVLAYTLPEALWLAETITDVVVGYPSTDRAAVRELAGSPEKAARITLMVDSIDHLDLIDGVVPARNRERIRVCIDMDASWRTKLVGHVGVRRSPIHEPADAVRLAHRILRRDGFTLVGLMAYEAQIAGVADTPPGKPVTGSVLRLVQRRSERELRKRRGSAVQQVRQVADLEFVNGGGTGSLESTSLDPSVTEIAAGSGLFGGVLFDGYRSFRPAPAAAFALDVVRRPDDATATVQGGGWIASGPPGADRLPTPVWPTGLKFLAREAAGEVQTPVTGRAAHSLRVGDRVWFRHAKSGELSEHVDRFIVLDDSDSQSMSAQGSVATYRGEGKAWL